MATFTDGPLMRKQEITADVGRAVAMLSSPSVHADPPSRDAEKVREDIHLADLWIAPSVVVHFDPYDWAALPSVEAEAIGRAVSGFRAIATAVPSNGPATHEQARKARELLLEISRLIDAASKV